MPLRKKKLSIPSSGKPAIDKWGNLEALISEEGCIWRSDDSIGIAGLSDFQVIKYAETDGFYYFFAALEKPVNCVCGADQSLLNKHGWTEVLRIMDLPIHTKKVVIFYKSRRYRCSVCKKTCQSNSEQVYDSHRMTMRLYKYICDESMSTERTFVSIEREVGVNNLIVREIQADYAAKLIENHVFEYSPWIGIDEVYPTSRKEPRCVICAPLEDRVLDILFDNDSSTLGEFLLQIDGREKIEVVSIDMHDPYRVAVRLALENAKIVVDRFHVQKLVNDALKDVIRVIRWYLTRAERETFLCPETYLLIAGFGTKTGKKLKRDSKVSAEKRETAMRTLFDRVPEVEEAYKLKEEFSEILDLWDFEKAKERARSWLDRVEEFRKNFHKKYEKFCDKARRKPFANIVSEFNSWFDEIVNYVLYKRHFGKFVTNAYSENLNRMIKEFNRRGYGYHIAVIRSKFIFGKKKSKVWSDPLKRSKKRKTRVKSERRDVNPNSNVCRIVDAYEQADKIGKLVPDPMGNEQYRDRSPVVKDEAPRQTDSRGLPVPRSWRDRRKVKLREFNEENFNGGNLEESGVSLDIVPSKCVQTDRISISCDQLKLFDQKLLNDSIEKVEGSRANSAVLGKHIKKARKATEKENPDQIFLFDIQDTEHSS